MVDHPNVSKFCWKETEFPKIALVAAVLCVYFNSTPSVALTSDKAEHGRVDGMGMEAWSHLTQFVSSGNLNV